MIGWLGVIATIATVYFGGGWLLDHPGEVQVNWFGYEVTLHIAVIGMLLLGFALLVALLAVQLWRIATWPARRRMRRQHRTFKRGIEQLTRGVAALSMGDEAAAEEAIRKASAALPGEPLPQLLTAQLLQRQGKHADAQAQFKALLTHESTAELATRKLIEQHVNRREWREAMALTESARAKTPNDRWLVLSLIDFYARERETAKMLALTEGWQWQSPLTKEERNRYSALAYYLAAQRETNPRAKERDLRHAVGYAPEFVPAVIDYAYLLLAQDSPRKARKWLLDAWRAKASPLLIAPILAALKPEKPRAQTRYAKAFLRGTPTAAHHLLAARHAIALGEMANARAALEDALLFEDSKEAATLMADMERKLRNDEAATSWTNRALQAPQGETWVCNHCGNLQAEWSTHCGQCEGFDTLNYQRPSARLTSIDTPLARMAGAI